jgi:hypothetical protein
MGRKELLMLHEIKLALRALGVRGWETAYTVTVSGSAFVVEVYLNGQYFGLWDTVKGMFVE